jgi:hypothetical protein
VHAAQSGTAMVRGKREAFGKKLKSFENRQFHTWNYGQACLEVVSVVIARNDRDGGLFRLRQVLLKQTECNGVSRSSLLAFCLEW